MKSTLLILLFCLPLLANSQILPQKFSEKDRLMFLHEKHASKIPFHEKIKLMKEKLQTPAGFHEKLIKTEEELLESFNSKIINNREIQLKLKEKILRSVQSDTLLLDSVYGYAYSSAADSLLFLKAYIEYNETGDTWCFWQCEWDSLSNSWINTYREDNFFDQNKNDTLIIFYNWDALLSEWIPVEKTVLKFDEIGRPILIAFYEWLYISKKWIGSSKYERAYDDWGNIIYYATYYSFDDINNSWIGYWKYEAEYDKDGNLLMSADFSWENNSSTWIGTYKTEYRMEPEKETIINYLWNFQLADWEYYLMNEFWHNESWTYMGNSLYNWNSFLKKWIGEQMTEYYYKNDTSSVEFGYTWNIPDEKWEKNFKHEMEWTLNNTYYKSINYIAKDSVIPSFLLNSFNSNTDISKIGITPSCPNQTCTALDSDYVEGNASLLWNYTIATGGYCQIDIDNKQDLSGTQGILFNYKVLIPSSARFTVRLLETNGETWIFEFNKSLSDTSGNWNQLYLTFASIRYPEIYVDGFFDAANIDQIQIQLHVPDGTTASGAVLIDNLSACNIFKTEQWQPDAMSEEFYDEEGNYIASISSRWDNAISEFVPVYKFKSEKVYDENGNLLQDNGYEWHEYYWGDWKWISRYENEYDENGYLIRTESYSWDDSFDGWTGTWKEEKDFNEQGNLLLFIYYDWNFITNDWIPYYKEEKTWKASGNLISETYYFWDTELDDWLGSWKQEHSYNEQNEQYKTISYEWDYITAEWKVYYIYLFSIYEEILDEYGNISAFLYKCWDEELRSWNQTEKYYYFYSYHFITQAIQQELNSDELILVYPNPATDYIHIKTVPDIYAGTINIYNNRGQKVKIVRTNGDFTNINVSDLPAGNYILNLTAGKNAFVRHIVIK